MTFHLLKIDTPRQTPNSLKVKGLMKNWHLAVVSGNQLTSKTELKNDDCQTNTPGELGIFEQR